MSLTVGGIEEMLMSLEGDDEDHDVHQVASAEEIISALEHAIEIEIKDNEPVQDTNKIPENIFIKNSVGVEVELPVVLASNADEIEPLATDLMTPTRSLSPFDEFILDHSMLHGFGPAQAQPPPVESPKSTKKRVTANTIKLSYNRCENIALRTQGKEYKCRSSINKDCLVMKARKIAPSCTSASCIKSKYRDCTCSIF